VQAAQVAQLEIQKFSWGLLETIRERGVTARLQQVMAEFGMVAAVDMVPAREAAQFMVVGVVGRLVLLQVLRYMEGLVELGQVRMERSPEVQVTAAPGFLTRLVRVRRANAS
jgi:hypothetical protein